MMMNMTIEFSKKYFLTERVLSNGTKYYTPGAKCPLCGYVFRQPRTTFTPNNNNNNNSNNGYQQDVNQYIDYDDYDD